jgi:subtilisin family serine protease
MGRSIALALTALIASLVVVTSAASRPTASDAVYLVAYAEGASAADARAAIQKLGGTVLREDAALGYAKVSTQNANFLKGVRGSKALSGAARDRIIATAEPGMRPKSDDIERLTAERAASLGQPGVNDAAPSATGEPLAADWQWDMRMIHATPSESYAREPGKSGVLVGVMDTGIDAAHPDIAPNFNAALSQNFTVDDELIDGKCALEPDHSCNDPATVDENSHGTHVAGTIASPINGFGMAGVAPGVTLVNIRAGQDSGFFFLEPTLRAMRYAGDAGIDVVNMSFYTDPWLYNCGPDHPATDPVTGLPVDSLEDQSEQQTIIDLSQRAIDYARARGVTFIGAAGNEHTNLGNPTFDDSSPDYPPNAAYGRVVTNFCTDVPTDDREGRLLELRHGADRRVGSGRLLPRRVRDAALPDSADADPRTVSGSGRQGVQGDRRLRQGPLAVRRARLRERQLCLLPADPGHLDGLATRRRRGCADRQPLRQGRQGARWADHESRRSRAEAQGLGDGACVSDAAHGRLHDRRPAPELQRHLQR